MKKNLVLLCLVCLCLAFSSCKKHVDEGFAGDVSYKETNRDTLGVSMTIPDNWVCESSEFEGIQNRRYTSLLGENDKFAESISVAAEKADSSKTLEEYAQENVDAIGMFYENFEIIEDVRDEKIGAENGKRFVYSYSMGTYDVVVDQSLVLIDGKLYIIICNSQPDSYPEYKEIFNTALKSFKVK